MADFQLINQIEIFSLCDCRPIAVNLYFVDNWQAIDRANIGKQLARFVANAAQNQLNLILQQSCVIKLREVIEICVWLC